MALALRVHGEVRHRISLVGGRPLSVGRLPDDPSGVALAPYLDEQSGRWLSRTHVRLELHDDGGLSVLDTSTNGTVVLSRSGPGQPVRRVELTGGQPHPWGEWDSVELCEGVELRRANRPTGEVSSSVMADAPTMSLRLPPA